MSRKKQTPRSIEKTRRQQEAAMNLLLSGDLAVVATHRFLGACEANSYTPPPTILSQFNDMRLAWQAFEEEQQQYDCIKGRV